MKDQNNHRAHRVHRERFELRSLCSLRSSMGKTMAHFVLDSPIGVLTLVKTHGFLSGLFMGDLTEGRTQEAARNLLTVLRARCISVPDAVRERILAQHDPERLERWLEKAAVASSVAAVLDEPN